MTPARAEHFWSQVDKTSGPDGCWPWTLYCNPKGYGRVKVGGRIRGAHIVAYELAVGPVPDGLVLDHVAARGCTQHSCCNPAHLEPVTLRENVMRAKVNRDACPRGHSYDHVDAEGIRRCSVCIKANRRLRYLRTGT